MSNHTGCNHGQERDISLNLIKTVAMEKSKTHLVRHLSLHVSVISVVYMEGAPVNIQQSANLHMLLLHLLIERSTQSGDINLET